MTERPAPLEAIAQDWAGLTKHGRVLISIDRVKSGQPLSEIVAHERAHAVLIRNTELGWVLNTLATFGLHPWPAGQTRERCYALLNVLTNATQWTQEGLATFLAGLSIEDDEYLRYRDRQPAMYLRAASQLDWLRLRGLDVQAQADVAIMLACLASGPPVLERWGPDRLTDVRRAQAWFGEPGNRPDARFPAVCRALSALGDAELVHLAADTEAARAAAGRLVRLAGIEPEFRLLPEDTRLDDVMRIVRDITAPLLDDPTLTAEERHRLAEAVRVPELAVRGLASSRMAILMTQTRGAVGRRMRDPGRRDLTGYDLATVQYNASFDVEPGLTPSGADPIPLLPREAVCYFSGPGRPPLAATFSAFAFRDWLDALDDSVTLAVLDTSYLVLGMPVPDLPALARRRHVVLVIGRTPYDLFLDIGASFDSNATVLVTVNASDLVGVSYVMLRRDSAPSQVILMPTVAETARETVTKLTGHQEGPRFRLVGPQDFFLYREAVNDVMRVIADFEGS
jgi:hypothetical protein